MAPLLDIDPRLLHAMLIIIYRAWVFLAVVLITGTGAGPLRKLVERLDPTFDGIPVLIRRSHQLHDIFRGYVVILGQVLNDHRLGVGEAGAGLALLLLRLKL